MEESDKNWRRKIKIANQAEILRAHQRDDDFVIYLREKFNNFLYKFGIKTGALLRFAQSDIPLKLLYFVSTTGLGNQTLGEEYTGIVQARLNARKVPSLTVRVLAAALECLGEKGLLKIIEKIIVKVNDPSSTLTPQASFYLNHFLTRLHSILPLLIMCHKGLFYLFGRYYSLGKRITGIDYVKVYGNRPTDGISWGLRILGVATLIQCILRLWKNNYERVKDDNSIEFGQIGLKQNCQLCLETVSTTATPCGHLFCWYCLADWLRTKPQCPLCREYVTSSRIVHLMNL